MMEYYDACEAEVTLEQARHEVEKHNLPWDEFVKEIGEYDTYRGRDVLDWLGY